MPQTLPIRQPAGPTSLPVNASENLFGSLLIINRDLAGDMAVYVNPSRAGRERAAIGHAAGYRSAMRSRSRLVGDLGVGR